jgi:hypothetical protein
MLRRIIPDLSFIFDAIVILLSDYIFFLPRSNIFIEGKLWKVSFFFSIFLAAYKPQWSVQMGI